MTTAEQLLAKYDEQVRGTVADRMPDGWIPSWDGPVLRVITPHRGIVFARDLGDLSVAELDRLIGRARDLFADRGEAVEWKTYGHDRPDLTQRLRLAGFSPDPEEAIVIGLASELTGAGDPPAGVTIRATADPADMHRIAAMESEVWAEDWSWLADDLIRRISTDPRDIVILVAEAAGTVVSAGWLVTVPGTEFAGLWGGSTAERWRHKGIYRALVARRARLAVDRGVNFLQVDASKDSRPILERLGLKAVGTTTPWVWSAATR